MGLSVVIAVSIFTTFVVTATQTQSYAVGAVDWRSAGMRCVVFIAFAVLIHRLQSATATATILQQLWKSAGICFIADGLAVSINSSMHRSIAAPTLPKEPSIQQSRSTIITLADLAATLERSLRESQPVPLSSRDPTGPSCVTVMKTGSIQDAIPPLPIDMDGGPGSAMGALMLIDRGTITSTTKDFEWHQTRLICQA